MLRLLVLALLWLALNGSDAASWIVGAPTVLAGAAINQPFLVRGAWRWRLRAALPMLCFFFRESFIGAFDVARRVIHPSLPIDPGFVAFRCRLKNDSARLLFADLITLMPGTLSARIDGRNLVIHALDIGADVETGLRHLEDHVAALFGERSNQVTKENP